MKEKIKNTLIGIMISISYLMITGGTVWLLVNEFGILHPITFIVTGGMIFTTLWFREIKKVLK